MLATNDSAPPIRARDEQGNWRSLADLSGPRGLVLVFYRGHWCPFCLHQLVEIGRRAAEFSALGYGVAALSVDAPERSAELRAHLRLPFPLLCDPAREVVKAWELFNARERGGIAIPATAVIFPDGRLAFFEREGMGRRIRPNELLAFLAQSAATPPRRRGFFPGWPAWRRALAPKKAISN